MQRSKSIPDGSPNWANKTIWTGDNLYIMRGMNSASVDLIYLDPPFNSNANYAAPIGSKAAGAAFKDTWTLTDIDVEWINLIEQKHPQLYRVLLAAMTKSDKSYLVYMAARLLEMKRLLKPTGSIYLHCDPTMSHYLKLLMDSVFGRSNFRNEIIWKRTTARNDGKHFGNVHDVILFYRGSLEASVWNNVFDPLDPEKVKDRYKDNDTRSSRFGPFQRGDLTASGTRDGESGETWRGINPTGSNRHWAVPIEGDYAEWIETHIIPNYRATKGVHDRLDLLDAHELIAWPDKHGGKPRLKRYLSASRGAKVNDVIVNIPPIQANDSEDTGFETQKPLALLRHFLRASSNHGDIVLDPFCGCATTCVAADDLGRNWVGIDISDKASQLVVERISDRQGLFRDIVHREDIPDRTDIGRIRRYNSPQNRKHLYGEQGGNCAGCGTHFESQHLEVDHITSRKKGGTDHLDNLQLLCSHCNRTKGDRGMAYLHTKLQIAA